MDQRDEQTTCGPDPRAFGSGRRRCVLCYFNPIALPVLGAVAALLAWVYFQPEQADEAAGKAPLRQPDEVFDINGLRLPESLLRLINAGRWRCPNDMSKINEVFPDHGDMSFYSFDRMPIENAFWLDKDSPVFLGTPDPTRPPGDLDPQRSVLIADMGIGTDQPIALDYRSDPADPPVVTLQWAERGRSNRWVTIAPNVEAFADLLGLWSVRGAT